MNKKLIALFLPILLVGCNPSVSSQNSNDVNTNSSSVVTVKTYNITIVENPNCKITTSKDKASRNETIEVYVTDIKEGYSVSKITVNGRKIDNGKFIMPNEDVVVEVFLKNNNNTDGINSIIVNASEYAVIWTDKETYDVGSNVNIEYKCKGNYVLDFFSVNGTPIEGTTFVMPDDDAIIEGTFKLVFDETPWQVMCSTGGLNARSFWYMKYGENGLEINVKVDDRMICGKDFKKNVYDRDNVEILITRKSDVKGWEYGETHKILISADGDIALNRALTGNALTGNIYDDFTEEEFNYDCTLKSLDNNDGYNGYEVNIFFSYDILWLTRDECVNNISVCPAIRNRTSHNVTDWRCLSLESVTWEDCSTHPILLEDGSYQERG